MKKTLFTFFLFSQFSFGQIAQYNNFPTLHNYKILDDKLDSISFAFSMRQLRTEYLGPLIRLRRASDNSELDFCKGFNDIVDIDSINSWRNGSNVFVTVWYDQSDSNRNAVQTNQAFQPRFIPDSARPYFLGDGINDRLDVLTDIKLLTNNGANGTVFSVLYSTNRNQISWGSVASGGNRWFAHLNWGNGQAYFDPGDCCNTPRSFVNPGNTWSTITCIRTNTNVIMRRNNIQQFNGTYSLTDFTGSSTFGILHAGAGGSFATTRFSELIMFKYDISPTKISNIEQDQIIWWNL